MVLDLSFSVCLCLWAWSMTLTETVAHSKQWLPPIPEGRLPTIEIHTPHLLLSCFICAIFFPFSIYVLLIHHCSPQFTLSLTYFSFALQVLLTWGAFPCRCMILNSLPVTCLVLKIQWPQKEFGYWSHKYLYHFVVYINIYLFFIFILLNKHYLIKKKIVIFCGTLIHWTLVVILLGHLYS